MQQGITSFIDSKPDYDLAPIGIASFQEQAEKLADMGRHGDTYIVHAAEGETVLPMEVLDANPQLKRMLFAQMRDMGIEPERYIIGSELNSINPVTGQPEFFLKKIFKGLKNVGKALKKNAATILPIALNYLVPGMGSTLAGTLGAGIGTLIQGDRENALRNALLGGATGATYAGLTGEKGFGANLAKDWGRSGTFLKGLTGAGPFAEGTFRFRNPFTQAGEAFNVDNEKGKPWGDLTRRVSTTETENEISKILAQESAEISGGMSLPGGYTSAQIENAPSLADIKYSSIPFTKGYTLKGPLPAEIMESKEYLTLTNPSLGTKALSPDKAIEILQKDYSGPSFLQKYGVPLAGITGAAALGGFFDTPEEEEQEPMVTGQELIDADPDKYAIDIARQPFIDQTQVASVYGIPALEDLTPYPFPVFGGRPVFQANQGGPAFPRRVGNIGPGVGSGRRDDVPAMLTDGEFVMTRKAVQNAGNGNLNNGMKNMYSLMRNLEARRA